MSEILSLTAEEWAPFGFLLARVIPLLEGGNAEHREVAANLRVILDEFNKTPPNTAGEVELQTQDLYFLGINLYLALADLEEYWLDRLAAAKGGTPAEEPDPVVEAAVKRYFPDLARDPSSWSFRAVQPAFIDLGMKIDQLLTAESPRVRGLYNKERATVVKTQLARQKENREKRQVAGVALPVALGLIGPGAAAAQQALPAPTQKPARPVGTAVPPRKLPPPQLSPLSRATFPGPYLWGVETQTGVYVHELEPNKPRRVDLGGTELMIVLIENENKVCAARRICPHRQWDLTIGGEIEDGVITCGLHGAQYEICSGAVKRQPYDHSYKKFFSRLSGLFDPKHTTEPLETYPTRIAEDGEILVHL
jgi:nitrite reductase/ring-hydroxylating ferredoxin subunit